MLATQIESTINHLFEDSKNDKMKIMKGFAKSILRTIQPKDFKDVYLSISKEQGEFLKNLVVENQFINIVEFGTSFGISTLYLAKGALETNGKIITTELIESKAKQAAINFEEAGVSELIEMRIGNAMETLKNHNEPVDLLFLDGWKDLDLPLFQMLEPNFKKETLIYVDNADMVDSRNFLKIIDKNDNYNLESIFGGKVVLIRKK